ncbi:MAG: lysylphosphatidylglycerol synthase transmembrane domain-containing protein [Pseudomonadota bacterium]
MIRLVRQFGILLLCAVILWLTVDWRAAAGMLANAQSAWLAGAVLLLTLQTVLSAMRWRIAANQLGMSLSLSHAVREYYLAQVVNQSLPGGVLGDANRALRTKGYAGLLPSAQAVIFERLAGQLGLIVLFLAGLCIGLLAGEPLARPIWIGFAGAAFLGAAILGTIACFLILRRFERLAMRIRDQWAAFVRSVFAREVWQRQVALSLATALCNVAAFAFCARAIGTPLSAVPSITLVPLILFAMVLPLSVGGWGLREGAAAALFPLWGASGAAGLAASVAFGLVILISVTPVFLVGWVVRKGPARRDGDLR